MGNFDIVLLKIPLQHISFYYSQPATTGQLSDCLTHVVMACVRHMKEDSLLAILIDPDEMPDDYKGMYNQVLMNVLSRLRISVWEEIVVPIIPDYTAAPLWNILDKLQPTHIRSFMKLYLCYKSSHAEKIISEKVYSKKTTRSQTLKAETYSTMWTLPCAVDKTRIDFIWDRVLELYKVLYRNPNILIPFCLDTPLSYVDKLNKHGKAFIEDTGEHKQIAARIRGRTNLIDRTEDYSIMWMPMVVPGSEEVIPQTRGVILSKKDKVIIIEERSIMDSDV